IDVGDEPKDDVRKRLLGVANSKLIRLHDVASTVKSKHGGHDKLADSTASALGRAKDKDYVAKLGDFSDARLLDVLGAATRRGATGATTTTAAAAARKPAAPKA